MEYCTSWNVYCPDDCPLRHIEGNCFYVSSKPILDLINRQKAEIEMLKGYGTIKARFKYKHNAEAYEQLMRGEG